MALLKHIDKPDYYASHRVLSQQEVTALMKRVEQGDQKAIETMVDCNMRLVIRIASRYRCGSYELRDLIQEGAIGLMRAIERFDYRKGYEFSTYAIHWIRQAICRAIEDGDRMIRLPSCKHEELRRVKKLIASHVRTTGKNPTIQELACIAELPCETIADLIGISYDAKSLDILLGDKENTRLNDLLSDEHSPDPVATLLAKDSDERVKELFSILPEKMQQVAKARYQEEKTLEEAGQTIHVSRQRAFQIETRIKRKLWDAMIQRQMRP